MKFPFKMVGHSLIFGREMLRFVLHPLIHCLLLVCWSLFLSLKECSEEIQTTLPKTNIAPEKRPFQKESGLPIINYDGLC